MTRIIRTAVFPVAGRGTRFLPATKASPKEMLPVVDKPLIQYAVEEALAAGAENLVFITGSSKRAIEDHFDSDPELEAALAEQGKHDLLDSLRGILPRQANCIYIRQPAPLGLGHAVLCARPVVGDEPFFVHLADDLIDAETPCLAQMAAVHARHGGSVLGVQTVAPSETHKYGIVAATEDVAESAFAGEPTGRVSLVQRIVEKPKAGTAPSNLAVVGRYILSGKIFEKLAKIAPLRVVVPLATVCGVDRTTTVYPTFGIIPSDWTEIAASANSSPMLALISKFAPGSSTSKLAALDVLEPEVLTAPMVKVKLPAVVGEPEILPVALLRVTPGGRDPDATKNVGAG
jgi:UTP--glucose-1-phosphate uridylyltransferase